MKILVCTKRVPDLETIPTPEIPPKSPADIFRDGLAWRMNRYDEYAVEAALQLRETTGASRIDALTVGEEDAEEVLRRAMGMGADHGVHILQTNDRLTSPFTIAGLMAAYARERAYDLILCGTMSEDLMQGLVGPIMAGMLGWPCLTSVHAFAQSERSQALVCEREIEGGCQEALEIDLPALLTIQSGSCQPRYPALSKLLRANTYPLEVFSEETLAPADARQRVVTVRPPEQRREGVRIEGSSESKAHQLAAMLRSKGLC